MSDQTFQYYAGDDWAIPLAVDDDGTPIDITGFSFWFTMKKQPSDPDNEAVIGPIKQTNHTDPVNGETTISVPRTDTAVATGEYFFGIQEKDSAGNITTLHVGKLEVLQGITQTTS